MIEELEKRINNKNYRIINDLVEVITTYKISSLDELKDFQDKLFTFNKIILNDKEKIDYCIKSLKSFPYDYDLLSFKEIQDYKQLMIDLENEKEIKEKIKILIKLYTLTQREMIFPYDAYNMLIRNEL